MRFTDINIPQGATIYSAYLNLCAYYDDVGGIVNSKVRGEDTANASTFSTMADFNARARTETAIYWDTIPDWSKDSWYTSPNIASVVQEIVDRPDWDSENSLVIFWDDFDGRSSGQKPRTAYTYDGSAAKAPRLYIGYGTLTSSSSWGGGACGTELVPLVFKLFQNSLNPFVEKTSIEYSVPSREHVCLKIYDVSGRCVKTLANEEKGPGYYKIQWDAKGLTSGIYFAKFKAGDYKEVKKLILLR